MAIAFLLAGLPLTARPASAQTSVPSQSPSLRLVQPAEDPDLDLWIPDEPAEVAAVDGQALYIGGRFSQVGPHTGPFAVVDQQTGQLVAGMPILDGHVEAVALDGAGGWFVGGEFDSADGLTRRRLAHVLADGSLSTFDVPVDGIVYALTVHDGVLYLGGHFVAVGGRPRVCLAAVDASTGSLLPWDPTFGYPWDTQELVRDLVVTGNLVIAGGMFEQDFLGVQRNNLVAIDIPTGRATSWNPDPDGPVWSVAAQGSDLFVGGNFQHIGGRTSPCFGVVDLTSGLAHGISLSIDKEVRAVAPAGDVVYLGGLFSSVGGLARSRAAAVSWSTSTVLPWDPDLQDGDGGETYLRDIEVQPDGVLLAGSFGTVGGERRLCTAEVTLDTGAVTSWSADAAGPNATFVTRLVSQDERIALGGTLLTVGGGRRKGVARLDLGTGTLTDWDPEVLASPTSDQPGTVLAILPAANGVYLGGSFRVVGKQSYSHLALVDDVSGAPVGTFVPGPFHPSSDYIHRLLLVDQRLFVAGFLDLAGSTMQKLAALDPLTGAPLPGWACSTGNVYALRTSPDKSLLYVGGAFDFIGPGGGSPIANLAALDLATGQPAAWAPQPDAAVRALAIEDDQLVVGGDFSQIGGVPRRRLAVLDRATGGATADIIDVAGIGTTHVSALCKDGVLLYVGGSFDVLAGSGRSNLASIDIRSWTLTQWCPDPALSGVGLALGPTALVLAGGADSVAHPHLAGWHLPW